MLCVVVLLLGVLAPSALASKPNLLLLFPDQWRFDWDTYHQDPKGSIPLKMPTFQGLVEHGTRFAHAYVAAPVCAPSRSCLASGREYDQAGVACNFCNDYPVNQTTFYKVLKEGGYWTMTAGKDDLTKASQLGGRSGYPTPQDGLYHQTALGFNDGLRYSGKLDVLDKYPHPHEMYGYYLKNQTVALENGHPISAWDAHDACFKKDKAHCDRTSYPDVHYEDDYTTRNAITLLDRKPAGKPWFMQVNFPGPHSPFLVTANMTTEVSGRQFPPPTDGSTHTVEKCLLTHEPGNGGRCNYAAELDNLDQQFARILKKIQDLGEWDNTVVVVSSDHGEMLGDHKDGGKTMPWQGSIGVPLVFMGPGVPKGKVIQNTPVSTMDMAATFLDFASLPVAAGMTSQSLRPLFSDNVAPGSYRSFISSGLQSGNFEEPGLTGGYNWRLVIQPHQNATYKFICCKGKCNGAPSNVPSPVNGWTQLLYDTLTDPFDMNNLAPKHPDVVKSMRALLPSKFGCGSSYVEAEAFLERQRIVGTLDVNVDVARWEALP